MTWNIPNILTISRIFMIPFFMAAFPDHKLIAFCLFIAASLTDFVDGYIARKLQMVTNFGKYMDPLADKLLVFSAIILFVDAGQMPVWIAMIVIARELLITGLRTIAAERSIIIAAGASGKVKTAVQTCGIILLLTPIATLSLYGVTIELMINYVILLVTVWSGIDYFYQYRHIFRDDNTGKK